MENAHYLSDIVFQITIIVSQIVVCWKWAFIFEMLIFNILRFGTQ